MDLDPKSYTDSLRKRLVLAFALNWRAPESSRIYPHLLVDACLGLDSNLLEVSDQLWRAGNEMTYEPKALKNVKICWNCGYTTCFHESSPQLVSYCMLCRSNNQDRPALWFVINCLQTAFRNQLHYLQIQAMLYDAVYLAKGILP